MLVSVWSAKKASTGFYCIMLDELFSLVCIIYFISVIEGGSDDLRLSVYVSMVIFELF